MTDRPPEPESNPLCGADPLARALAALRPAPAAVDANRLMFLAGRADRDRAVALWRRAFLGMSVLLMSAGSAATLFLVRLANTEPPIVYRDRPATTLPAPSPPLAPEGAPMPREFDGYHAPSPPARYARTDPPFPADVAEYLRVRHEVLTAGLGLIPDRRPQTTPATTPDELERSLNLPPGVLTAPFFTRPPKPKSGPDIPD